MTRMRETEPAPKLTLGIYRAHSGKPTGMRGMKCHSTNQQEAFMNRIHKGVSRIQIRIESFM
jgi:hypothetical protein